MSTWEQVGDVLDQLKAGGEDCPLVTACRIHLENFSAYHDVPFATQDNGFAGLDTELSLNGLAQVAHLSAMGQWAKDGKFIYTAAATKAVQISAPVNVRCLKARPAMRASARKQNLI